jgi:serine/threonine-protein kinase
MVLAIPFDLRARRTNGSPIPLQESVRLVSASNGDASAYLSHAGGLVFARGEEKSELVWVNRKGEVNEALDDAYEFTFVRISPNGRQAAVSVERGASSDIWVLDLATKALTRLTNSGSARNPVWAPDGAHILFVSTHGGRSAIWRQPVDGSAPASKVADTPHNAWQLDLGPDGRRVVFNAIYDGSFNLETILLDSPAERRDISASPVALEAAGRISPDGRAVAYVSNESGRPEVYIRSFPDGGSRVQVSTTGGIRPVWSKDGKVYYRSQERVIEAILERNPQPRVVRQEPLFSGEYEREFDVAPDGSRFLMLQPIASDVSIVAIPNWITELRKLTAGAAR